MRLLRTAISSRTLLSTPIIPRRTHITDPQNLGCTPMSSSTHPAGPIETAIRTRISETLKPVLLDVRNDSSKHAHHAPMKAIGGGSGESHFSVTIVSPSFIGVPSIKRHRQVNALFKEEFAMPHGVGLHALSLKTKTPEEWENETGESL